MQLQRVAALGLLPLVSGCYASLGPTAGLDLKTGRATLGVEASGETITLAHSVALGTRSIARAAPANTRDSAGSKAWSTHTYLLWEPGFGGALSEKTEGRFVFLGSGASAGMRWNRYDGAPPDSDFVLGAWANAGQVLTAKGSRECGARDTRPFAALVVGIRGFELYASPKIGVMDLPGVCLNLFGDEAD
ncbi:MAG TPA: hypothetical protein VJV79_07445 [Polyangiaceae bacterium]|nr:hypothetical protein [Polyangiaceae bacterium]